MDLVAALKNKIELLDDGEHMPGLRAVLLHIETAFRHLSRGQQGGDGAAFTDALYRTNQAFEGSIKEAYRVLAGKDPENKRPFDIEGYLEKNKVFRSRVLSQFTTYRKEWRNPSAHDYKLDFDESEAFLAIVSVSAFACLLFDQISERISYLRAQAEAESQKRELALILAATEKADLLVRTVDLLCRFSQRYSASVSAAPQYSEAQVIGALHGFLASAAPELTVHTEAPFKANGRTYRADLIIRRGDEGLVVELKRRFDARNLRNVLAQVENYVRMGGFRSGIAFFLPESPMPLLAEEIEIAGIDGKLAVLAPVESKQALRQFISG